MKAFAGIGIGILVGIICGIIVLTILRTLNSASIKDTKYIRTLTIQLLSVITIVVGATFLKDVFPDNIEETIKEQYFLALSTTFLVLMFYPLGRWVYKIGHELGEFEK